MGVAFSLITPSSNPLCCSRPPCPGGEGHQGVGGGGAGGARVHRGGEAEGCTARSERGCSLKDFFCKRNKCISKISPLCLSTKLKHIVSYAAFQHGVQESGLRIFCALVQINLCTGCFF